MLLLLAEINFGAVTSLSCSARIETTCSYMAKAFNCKLINYMYESYAHNFKKDVQFQVMILEKSNKLLRNRLS